MSQINVTTIKSRLGGAPTLSEGLVCSGIATFSNNVSVAGTLTYNDVTNIDSVGIITAQSGIRIGTGGTIGPAAAGVVTYFGDGSNLTGIEGGVAGVNTTGFSTFKDVSVQGISTFSNLTDSSSTTTGALVISGGVGIAKSMYIGGNIAFASGQGIDFSATSHATTCETEVLSDYEHGYFTVTNSGAVNWAAGADILSYVKVGGLVQINGQIECDTGTGDAQVTNLPFSVANNGEESGYACGALRLHDWDLNSDTLWCVAQASGSTLGFRQCRDDGSAQTLAGDNGAYAMISITYLTDD